MTPEDAGVTKAKKSTDVPEATTALRVTGVVAVTAITAAIKVTGVTSARRATIEMTGGYGMRL